MSRNQLIPEMYRFQPERPLWALMISSLAATNATECLGKDKKWLFTPYDFPAQHWSHLRTTNRTESSFAHCSASHSANQGMWFPDRYFDHGLQTPYRSTETLVKIFEPTLASRAWRSAEALPW